MTAPVIILPAQFRGLTLAKVAGDVVAHAQDGWPLELIFDFGHLNFIRPAGVVFLSNLVHWLHEQNTTVKFRNTTRVFRALVDRARRPRSINRGTAQGTAA